MALRIRFQYPTGSRLGYSIERLSDGMLYDSSSSTFVASPTTPISPLPEDTGIFAGRFRATLATTPASQFSDGDYAVTVHDQARSGVVAAELSATFHAGDDATASPAAAVDPWSIALPGAYASGTAGSILGTNLDAQVSSRSTFAGGAVAAVTAPVTVGTVTDKAGYALSATGLDQVAIESGIDARQALSAILSWAAGTISGGGTGTLVIKGANTATTRIVETVDGAGNRSSVTLTLPAPAATVLTVTGPSSGTVNTASTAFTVTPNGTYNGTITVTPSGGGLSAPIVLTFAFSSAPQTFTIAPTSAGNVTLAATNNRGLANPSTLNYAVSLPTATAFTLTGPSSGNTNTTSANFTVTPVGGIYSGTITVTPSGGGLSTPSVLTFGGSAAAQSFTITPTSAGTVTLTPTNSGSLTNPAALTYTATAVVHAHTAALFDGSANSKTGQAIGVASSTPLQAGTGGFTVGGWININDAASLAANLHPILSKFGATPALKEYMLFYANGPRKFAFFVNGTELDGSATTPAINTWYHVTGVFDGAKAHLYVNGAEDTTAIAATAISSTAPAWIGGAAGDSNFRAFGSITQVYKYPFALTPAQVTWMYNGGAGRGSAEVLAQAGLGRPDCLYCMETPGNLGLDRGPNGLNMTNSYATGPISGAGPG